MEDTVSEWTWLDVAIVGTPDMTVAASLGLVAVAIGLALAMTILRRRRLARGADTVDLDSPTAILEEMRKRLEDLPTLPQFAARRDSDLPLPNPFSEPNPIPRAIVDPTPPPAPLPTRRSAPPLPTDAEDPITGEIDEMAYRNWLREWLVYAEQYGEETDDDPVLPVDVERPNQ